MEPLRGGVKTLEGAAIRFLREPVCGKVLQVSRACRHGATPDSSLLDDFLGDDSRRWHLVRFHFLICCFQATGPPPQKNKKQHALKILYVRRVLAVVSGCHARALWCSKLWPL